MEDLNSFISFHYPFEYHKIIGHEIYLSLILDRADCDLKIKVEEILHIDKKSQV